MDQSNSCCLFSLRFLDLPPLSLFSADQVSNSLVFCDCPDFPDSVTALLRHIVKLQNNNIWEAKHKD